MSTDNQGVEGLVDSGLSAKLEALRLAVASSMRHLMFAQSREGLLQADTLHRAYTEMLAEWRLAASRITSLEGELRSSNASPSPLDAARHSSEAGSEPSGEEFLEFKEALGDLRSLRAEHRDLNGGGPGWMQRWLNAWVAVDELFANEDEAAWCRQQEDAHG